MTGDFGGWTPGEAIELCERALGNLAVVNPPAVRDAVAGVVRETRARCDFLRNRRGDRSSALLGTSLNYGLRLAEAVADAKPGDSR
jgi:hypothetical protein